ncbi:LytR/AlgR family response regulator transcription factor [Moraxella atlantae]|uniref:LytR/AlgR family response regulator transcription factor n=1 Tax=Faucicola atlantae TaxID=34059 RepID=UPI0037502AD4
MRVVICDDEPLARERLKRIIQAEGHEVVGEGVTGLEGIEQVKATHPDVILLDIRMPKMDGIRCAKELSELDNPPAIIFVTAYDHYAIAAFKAHAIGYLLKPANREELSEAMARAAVLNTAQLSEMRRFEDRVAQPSRQHIAARTHRGIELIALSDIYYFYAEQKYVQVRHKTGTVLIDETLKDLEKEFGDMFFRIHRNALINLDYLAMLEVVDQDHYRVRFKGIDEKLAVSRRHLPVLREKIQNL